MMTLKTAHEAAVHGDRALYVRGVVVGRWYEDRILDYIYEHGTEPCVIESETDSVVTVRLTDKEGT